METPAEIQTRWRYLRELLIEQLGRFEDGSLQLHANDLDRSSDAIRKLKQDILDFDGLIAHSETVAPTVADPVPLRITAGFQIGYQLPAPTPMLLMLSIHPSRRGDLETNDLLVTDPPVDVRHYRDSYGNICSRLLAPAGDFTLSTDFVIRDSGLIDEYAPQAQQHAIEDLPDETVLYLLGSRYCETDRLSDIAWSLFQNTPPGWERVQAITDYVHHHIAFNHANARPDKTAYDAWMERSGVCRDYAHLAVAFCRCMNIPARYCTGYLGDIGVPINGVMDFSAWFEVYLGDRWYAFDARNNMPRMARVLMAIGRDAVDVPIAVTFGVAHLTRFEVVSTEAPIRET